LFSMGLFFALRGVLVLFHRNEAVSLLQNSAFLIAFICTIIVASLGFNMTCIGLVISRMLSQVKKLSIEDPLTQTFNRRHINEVAQNAINKMYKEGQHFSIIMLDIDHFKKVNDTYGHAAGDQALVVCANVLRRSARGTDFVGRLGGEEFCVILPETSLDAAKVIAERLRQTLEQEIVMWEGHQIPITASFGVSSLTKKDEWSSLLNRADIAMYQAKKSGRNQIAIA
jgi:diguanylate cyclase (GGDEF)-like protein